MVCCYYIKSENRTLQNDSFLICGQLMRQPLIELLHLSKLLQMPYDHRIVNVAFFCSFSCSCKKISFDDCSQLVVVNFEWPTIKLLIFKGLVFFAELLELPLHCMFISSSWARCVVDVVSCLHCFMIHFEFE